MFVDVVVDCKRSNSYFKEELQQQRSRVKNLDAVWRFLAAMRRVQSILSRWESCGGGVGGRILGVLAAGAVFRDL